MLYCLIKQEGQAPCQTVSPQLDVGGPLQKHASNGSTNVLINGREITKKELKVLKVVLRAMIIY